MSLLMKVSFPILPCLPLLCLLFPDTIPILIFSPFPIAVTPSHRRPSPSPARHRSSPFASSSLAPRPTHPMNTRSKFGIFKPRVPLSLSITYFFISHIPRTYREALIDSNWRHAMLTEFAAFIKIRKWDLVPPSTNVVSGNWLFRHKYKSGRTLERYKTSWVAQGSINFPALIMMKPSALSSNRPLFGLFSPSLSPNRCLSTS